MKGPRAPGCCPRPAPALATAVLLVLLGGEASARKVGDIELDESVTVSGRALRLNGAGVRKKLWFEAYVGGLYLEAPSQDPLHIVQSQQVKRLELVFARSVDRKTLARTMRGDFEKNSLDELPALRERLEQLLESIPNIKAGERLILDFVPGQGVLARHRDMQLNVKGDDFARALLRVWLGPRAPNDGLRQALLGLS